MFFEHAQKSGLFAGFINRNGDGDGGADHGVVAHADETHHFYVKACLRQSFGINKPFNHILFGAMRHIISTYLL